MNLAAALSRGRAAAEAMMVDTCTIREWDGTYTNDEATGDQTKNYTQVYSGKCRIQQRAAVAMEDEGAGRTVSTLRLELQLPIDAIGLKVDHEVVCDTSAHDPDLPGREFRISALHHKSHATARRVAIEEVTS